MLADVYDARALASDVKPMVGGHRLSEAKPRPKTDEACEAKQRFAKQFHQQELKDVEYNEKTIMLSDDELIELLNCFIMLSDDELIELLNCFDCHNDNLIHDIAPLYNSPYTKDKIIDVITKWYNQTLHKTPDDIAGIVNRYYHYEDNNKWLFSLIKKIDDDTKTITNGCSH